MIRHILFITLTDDASPDDINAVRLAFLRIPRLVKGVTRVEWGVNDSPEDKNARYTYCVLMTFADEATRQYYLPHPDHDALKTLFRPVLQDIVVLDFTLAPENVAGE
ncbi:Dabb family protein [Enterobacter hormaechei]|nr:Dabb family protein [Enterobacter hormaechei]